jgi:hypothetical protein
MISSKLYRRLEPHEHVRNQVLEDILIGRYLHRNGIAPRLVDFQNELAVYMYRDFPDAWRGFRKNASAMMGRTVTGAGVNLLLYVLVFLVAPIASPIFLLSLYGMKAITDRATHVSVGYTLLAPVSYVLAAVLTLDSIVSRGRGRLTWKGRNVSRLRGRGSGTRSSEGAGAA